MESNQFQAACNLCSLKRKNGYKVDIIKGEIIGPYGKNLGNDNGAGYKIVYIYGKNFLIHRFIYMYAYGYIDDKLVIDHINRNRLDNRLVNLRAVDRSQNQKNRFFKKTCNK